MRFQDAKSDVLFILSWFSETFSSPSYKLFSAFIVSFIQLGKEAHTSSLVRTLSGSFLQRSLYSFTRFLGKNAWAMEEVFAIALTRFFHTLRIKAHSALFLVSNFLPAREKREPSSNLDFSIFSFRAYSSSSPFSFLISPSPLKKGFHKWEGKIRFLSAHNITPTHLDDCMTYLEHMLRPENQVTIVTKPHQHISNALKRFVRNSQTTEITSCSGLPSPPATRTH